MDNITRHHVFTLEVLAVLALSGTPYGVGAAVLFALMHVAALLRGQWRARKQVLWLRAREEDRARQRKEARQSRLPADGPSLRTTPTDEHVTLTPKM